MAGVGDKPAKKREARLLTKGEQLLYPRCVKALPLAYSGQCQWEKLGVGKGNEVLDFAGGKKYIESSLKIQ
jgi:hypothetical protein